MTERIFNAFTRLHNNSKYEGTGPGLSLCRKIILQHHGVIYVKSRENEGSSFYLYFPQPQALQPVDEQPKDAMATGA